MKKIVFILLALYGAWYYASRRFEFHDTLTYAKKNPQAHWAPAVDYYVGLVYYQRARYDKAQEALTQLLTDYPTCQYAASGLVHLDDVAEYNHDWETARAALKRYVEEYPQGHDIEVMRKRLELLNYQHP